MEYKHTKDINDRIIKIRKALGLKKKEMAAGLSMSASNYGNIERGATVMLRTVNALVDRYGVNYDYLVNGVEPMFCEPTKKQAHLEDSFSQLSAPFQDLVLRLVDVVKGFDEEMQEKNAAEKD